MTGYAHRGHDLTARSLPKRSRPRRRSAPAHRRRALVPRQARRGRAAYDAGHLPGAIHLDLDDDLVRARKARAAIPSPPGRFERSRGDGGARHRQRHVSSRMTTSAAAVAARLWWMLDNLGLRDGVRARRRHQRVDGRRAAASTEPRTGRRRASSSAIAWTNVIERDELSGPAGLVTLIDARAGAALPRRGRAGRPRTRATSRPPYPRQPWTTSTAPATSSTIPR